MAEYLLTITVVIEVPQVAPLLLCLDPDTNVACPHRKILHGRFMVYVASFNGLIYYIYIYVKTGTSPVYYMAHTIPR